MKIRIQDTPDHGLALVLLSEIFVHYHQSRLIDQFSTRKYRDHTSEQNKFCRLYRYITTQEEKLVTSSSAL